MVARLAAMHTPMLLIFALLCMSLCPKSTALPAGWREEAFINDLNQPLGMVWGANSPLGTGERVYVWEKPGRVLAIDGGVRHVLLDIQDEVMSCCDHGLLGFALHPNFKSNGYFYTLYVLEKKFIGFNDPLDTAGATISRLSRWTAGKVATRHLRVPIPDMTNITSSPLLLLSRSGSKLY